MEKIIKLFNGHILTKKIIHIPLGCIILFNEGAFGLKHEGSKIVMKAVNFKNEYKFTADIRTIVNHLKGYIT